MGKKNLLLRRLNVMLHSTRKRDIRIRQAIWTTVIIFCVIIVIAVDFIPKVIELKVGEKSPIDVQSPTFIEVIDIKKTEELQQAAAEKVAKAYDYDVNVTSMIVNGVSSDFSSIKDLRNKSISEEKKIETLKNILGTNEGDSFKFTTSEFKEILNYNDNTFENLETILKEDIVSIWQAGIKEEDFESAKGLLIRQLERQDLPQAAVKLMANIGSNNVRPNLIYNRELTEKRILQAKSAVPEVKKRIEKGETIIKKGEIATAQHIAELEALGLQRAPVDFGGIISIVILIMLIFFGAAIYLYLYYPHILFNEQLTILLGIIILFIVIVAKVWMSIALSLPSISSVAGFFIPTAAGSLLIAILLEKKLAVFMTLILGMLVGIIAGYNFYYMLFAIIGGTAAVYSVSHLSQRRDIMRAGIIASGVNALVVLSVTFGSDYELFTMAKAMALGILNGLVASVIAGGTLPYIEDTFRILTDVKLLELSNPNHPLLKKLLLEAPGTYHHSIIVGNLAEAGAEAVGASPLLARVGSYYHDIGKTKRPYFFIENQITAENPHDKIAPGLSTLIITSHTKDGAELGRKYKLPKEIIDIIQQHHGTSLLAYFYHRALEDKKNDKLVDRDFRYLGPKPQTKEAAVVMLADSVEAAVRSMEKANYGQVEAAVRKLIKEKLNDGQLDESDLTLRDLEKIREAFLIVLSGIFHSRIEYPDDKELKELERRRANGRSGY